MFQFRTINTETGDYVMYTPETGQEEIIATADTILCHGHWDPSGANVILKDSIPDLGYVHKPKLLYSRPGFVIINPETGPSIIISQGQVIPNSEYRVLCVTAPDPSKSFWLVTDTWLIRMHNGAITSRWEHKIQNMDDSIVSPGVLETAVVTYRSNQKWFRKSYCVGMILPDPWTQIKGCQYWHQGSSDMIRGPDQVISCRDEPIFATHHCKNLDIIQTSRDWSILVDLRTNEYHTRKYDRDLVAIATKADDFTLNGSVVKFYQQDGSVILFPWHSGQLAVYCAESNHLPKPRLTGTKSARSG